MEVIILIGLQASGKSTFCRERFFRTHLRINLDMLRSRHRERRLIQTCLELKQRLVVDNTNPTPEDRQRYLQAARTHQFRTIGYYLNSSVEDCLRRNAQRPPEERIPPQGIFGTAARLVPPSDQEDFDELYVVRGEADCQGQMHFVIRPWSEASGVHDGGVIG